ncbi:MAG: hypothetical protein IT369_23640 [Candidatus Latescibacteria bacterium]|nr:hypothetical protein [Candidatus Latescibacterota bacterium]
MNAELPPFLLAPPLPHSPLSPAPALRRSTFVDQGMQHLGEFLRTTHLQWEMARRDGLLQRLDARVKVLFLVFFVVLVSLKKTLAPELGVSGLVLILAVLSRLNLVAFYQRVLALAFFFGFLLSLPACLNLFIPGTVVVPLLHLAKGYARWGYYLPPVLGVTREGLHTVALLTARVTASIGLSLLVIHTTPLAEFLKALKALRVPAPFLMVMALSLKFIFVFVRTLEEMYLAQKSRTVAVSAAQGRVWVAGRMAFLFRKTQYRYEEVFKAMVARGFAGEITSYAPRQLRPMDWLAGTVLLGAGLLVWVV